MTRATITIKRKSGIYDQLWYINANGFPDALGKEIFTYLKTVDDVERAVVIFNKMKCRSYLETAFTLGEVETVQPILAQYNDYAYILDEETEKWGYYSYDRDQLHDLEDTLKNS